METPLPQRTGLRRLLSPAHLVAALRGIAHRFTFTFVFVSAATLYTIFTILFPEGLPGTAQTAIAESLALGTLLTLASYLWGEYFGKARFTATALALSVIVAVADFLMVVLHLQALNDAHYTGYASVVVACVVAIAFTPPLRHVSMGRRWLFTMRVVKSALLSWCIAMVLTIALYLIYITVGVLFGLRDFKCFACLMAVFGGFIPALAFLHMLPRPGADGAPDSLCRTLAAFCKNILLPLALVYIVILYIYTVKIIATWTLPNGQITWMVTGIVSVVLVTVYGLQGYLCDLGSSPSAKRIASMAHRFLPMLTLPLLVLMSVAIFYRIGQYGLTTSRLYVATFNIWAYLAVTYIMVARRARLNAVAASFAIVFLATSIVPGANYCAIGNRIVQNKAYTALREAGVEKFPISYNELRRTLDTMPKDRAREIADNLEYLDSWDDHSAVAPIVAHDGKIMRWELVGYNDNTEVVELETTSGDRGLSPVPEGLHSIRYLERTSWSSFNSTDGTYTLEIDSTAIVVPVDSLIRTRAYDFAPVALAVEGSDATFRLTDISLRADTTARGSYRYISVKGYLLEK